MTFRPDLLDRLLVAHPPAFALLERQSAEGVRRLEVFTGEVSLPRMTLDIPLLRTRVGGAEETLVIVPYRQISERGFACVDDAAPIVAMKVNERAVLPVAEALARIPITPIRLSDGHFDPDDESYARLVRRIVESEIGEGAGSNFVIKRSYVANIAAYDPRIALAFFRRLSECESGAYWTFIMHTGDRTLVGASPERHVSLREGVATMNPISGTYRHPPAGPTLSDLLEFLEDGKENDELFMVVDEELKMMARLCEGGGRVLGPFLKEMAWLTHTEYLIEGKSRRDPREILRETMFAPTVTGSPLESACRVIERYEPAGRGYYGGAIALLGHDGSGAGYLDSAILIRTADIDGAGRLKIDVGATLVRLSDPASEAAETRAKVAGLLGALNAVPPPARGERRAAGFGKHAEIRTALDRRNDGLARFWLSGAPARVALVPALAGRRVLVVDAEDDFTAMLAHQLRALELHVVVRRFDEEYSWEGRDLVVMGPGPGDPRDAEDPRIAHLYAAISALLAERRPFLAVCLSHQVLSRLLGLRLARCKVCHQGTQRAIDLFGERELVGFYNTFAAHSDEERIEKAAVGSIEVCRDAQSGEVHALRGPHFASMQFHAESVLTLNGPRILANRIKEALGLATPMKPMKEALCA